MNIIPNVRSVYRWKGNVCDDGEMLAHHQDGAANSRPSARPSSRVNTYELPEVLAYRVDWASPGFAEWVQKLTASPRPLTIRKTPRSTAAPVRSFDASLREGPATAASVAFLSLFLGLTSGDRQVRLAVQGRIAEVQLLLDGEEVARLDTPPWIAPIDLGPQLVPHELVARCARPAGGRSRAGEAMDQHAPAAGGGGDSARARRRGPRGRGRGHLADVTAKSRRA